MKRYSTVIVNSGIKNGNDLSLYLDGVLVGGPTDQGIANVISDDVTLGARLDGQKPYDGFIAEVLLYSTALSDPEREEIEDCLLLK
jgi:hypothetical protein